MEGRQPRYAATLGASVEKSRGLRMKKKLKSILGTIPVSVVVLTGAAKSTSSIEQLYSTKATWESMNWVSANQSPLWTIPGWQPYKTNAEDEAELAKLNAKYGAMQVPDEKWVSTRRVTMFGQPLTASLAYRVRPDGPEYFTVISAEQISNLSRADCDRLFLGAAAIYGKPIVDDASYFIRFGPDADSQLQTFIIKQQWTIGPTRATATCLGLLSLDATAKQDPLVWSIVFSAANTTPALVPKFALRCTRRAKLKARASTDEMSGIAFWVDLNVNMATRPTHESFGDEGSFKATEDTLSFKATSAMPKTATSNGRLETNYEINRFTGALSGHSILDGQEVAELSGKCEKSESLDPKF
jgi:hypothetical protein